MVLGRGAQERGPPDVDFLDRLVPLDVEPANCLLEGVEVDADEVDRLDAVRGEVGDILRNVATGEDAAVDSGVQRDDTVSEHLGEARQLLERDHRDPFGGEQLRRTAAGKQLEVETAKLLGERRHTVLVVDGEQGPPHAAVSSLTTSGSSLCSTSLIRACSVSGVSPGNTATDSCRRIAPVSRPASTR